jgi:hypothetical protein
MKNVHLVPTKNQYKGSISLTPDGRLSTNVLIGIPYNLYITNSEEIKEGDWHLNIVTNKISKYNIGALNPNRYNYRKIILTTDTELIADGVQAIDDEFLEWFVKNPSCESVEVKKRYSDFTVEPFIGYKIIIPQEEPKQSLSYDESVQHILTAHKIPKEYFGEKEDPIQETVEEFTKGQKYIQQDGIIILAGENKTDGMVIYEPIRSWGVGHYSDEWNPKAFKLYQEPKSETLEEAAKNEYPIKMESCIEGKIDVNSYERNLFIKGAKYQAGISYNEEEVIELLQSFNDVCNLTNKPHQIKNFFQQFKKK